MIASSDPPPDAPDVPDAPDAPATETGRRGWVDSLLVALVAAAAAVILLPLTSRYTGTVGPGTVEVSVAPSRSGVTQLALPPLGTLSADTHDAPTAVRLRLEEVDVRQLQSLGNEVGLPDRERLVDAVSDDLPGLFRTMVVRLGVLSSLIGVGVALVVPGRRPVSPPRARPGSSARSVWWMTRRAVVGGVAAPLAVAVVAGSTLVGYDVTTFDSPRLTGQLALAGPLLSEARGGISERLGLIDERTRALSTKLASLYSSAITSEVAESDGQTVILHVSDIHLNPVGISLARQLADTFKVDAVLDTGDLTSFGQEPEAAMVSELGRFDVPYLFVAGNHDGAGARERIAEIDGVTALDGEVAVVGGVTILGIADPTETALRTIPRDELLATYANQHPTTERLVERHRPDLLAVHNPIQAKPVLGDVPAVAAGHLHEVRLSREQGTLVTVVGSSGATGLGALLVETDETYSFEILRFVAGRLVAVDTIELRGTNGEFDSRRRLVGPDRPVESDERIAEDLVEEPALDVTDGTEPDAPTNDSPTNEK